MRQSQQSTAAAAEASSESLPRWDLSAAFPGIDTPGFSEAFADWLGAIDGLAALFDAESVGGDGGAVDHERFARVLTAVNDTLERTETMGAYLSALVSADSRDDAAQARLSEFSIAESRLTVLRARFTAWLGAIDLDRMIAESPLAAAHAFPLRKGRQAAAHLLPPAEEALAAALAPSGGIAWSKLHDNLTSQLKGMVEIEGESRALPLSAIRNLALSPDAGVRRRAYEAELALLADHAAPIAAALNGVKGQVVALGPRRGWSDPLDASLFTSNIDRQTLDALLAAARAAFPDLRRYLRLKARVLGEERLPWWDLFAPVGRSNRRWNWPDAVAFLETQFGRFSDRMRGLARRAVTERWIDAGPRPAKVGGAFCTWLIGDQSRILMNFSPTYDAVSTLAHELGHAYHNLNEAGLTPLQRETPMTLAETASTFCETIVREAALRDAGEPEQLFIIEQSLQGSCQIVVDIISRFDFERAVFAVRPERELSIGDFNRLMRDAQLGTYGDALDPDHLHPYMWAVKSHYYIPGFSFYNYPYLFGLLFGLGLYARYRADPAGFIAGYDQLLASTGRADAADLAARFGIDIRSTDFWTASLDVIRADVDRFEELVDRVGGDAAATAG
jgi:pepF/M3 family oligoendopeptidase